MDKQNKVQGSSRSKSIYLSPKLYMSIFTFKDIRLVKKLLNEPNIKIKFPAFRGFFIMPSERLP